MLPSVNAIIPIRRLAVLIIAGLIFIVLILRLYNLQISHYRKFVGMAESNRVRVVPIEAPRGIIYDRNSRIIADNKFQYNINIIPFELRSSQKTYQYLSELLGLQVKDIRHRVQKNWRGRFLPAKVAEDIDFQTLTKLEEHKLELPGVLYSLAPLRSFPAKTNLSHVIGYLREIDRHALERIKHSGYRLGDLIGWKGVERRYESILRGKTGYRYVQVNAHGQAVSSYTEKTQKLPEPGNDLYLTIDLDLQQYIETLMQDTQGVAIVLNPDNGEIISFISKPDYSPNLFSGIIDADVWNQLRNNPVRPLYNRVTQGLYPPGSTFKLITAMVAIEDGYIDTTWTVRCVGRYRLGRRSFHCWKSSGHGKVDIHSAIAQSCNVFFYHLIRRIDIDLWAKTARTFYFGSSSEIDLPNDARGVVPDRNYMDNKYGTGQWTEGNKLNLVIGQGDLLVTPIQMARFISIIATNGKVTQPHLGLKYYDKKVNNFKYFSTQKDSVKIFSPDTWRIVQNGMYSVVNDKDGTGKAAHIKGTQIFGKTGTAQNPHGKSHAWFIGYADYNPGKIAVVILIEHGGGGGETAAPIAGKIFKYYQKQKKVYAGYESD